MNLSTEVIYQVFQDESHIYLTSKPLETLYHPDYPETLRKTANHHKGTRILFTTCITSEIGEIPGTRWMFSPNHRNSKMKREALARVREVQKEGAKRKQTDSTSTEPSGKERKTQGDTAIEKEVRELRQEIKIVTANPEDYHAFLDWKMFERYMMGSQKSDPITSDSPDVGFLKQFEKAFPGRKAIFICDNAPYHVVFPEDWPKAGASKDVKEIFLRSRGVTLPEKTTVLLLNAELKRYKEEQQVKGICRLKTLLESRGHILLLTPPTILDMASNGIALGCSERKGEEAIHRGQNLGDDDRSTEQSFRRVWDGGAVQKVDRPLFERSEGAREA